LTFEIFGYCLSLQSPYTGRLSAAFESDAVASSAAKKGKKDKKGKKGGKKVRDSEPKQIKVNRDRGEMPEGADASDDEKKPRAGSFDPVAAALNVDLSTPLGDGDTLPTIRAYDDPLELRRKEEAKKLRREEDARRALEKVMGLVFA
jgi:hypothetical protein